MTTSSAPVWLLGAGASIGAGMPSTGQLTETVRFAQPVARHTNKRWRLGAPATAEEPESSIWTSAIRHLLAEAHALVSRLYEDQHTPVSYEDLHYVVCQMADLVSGEYDNPAVGPLVEGVRARLDPQLATMRLSGGLPVKFQELVLETTHFVVDVVAARLSAEPDCEKLGTLRAVVDGLDDGCAGDGTAVVATLNHDKVLESALKARKVTFTDGFDLRDGDLRFWSPRALEELPPGVVLLKVHGSVDWSRWEPQAATQADEVEGKPEERRVGIVCVSSEAAPKDACGRAWSAKDGRQPCVLVGTFNKMLDYAAEPFFDLHAAFVRSLRRTDRLVVCGYGFGDKGVNRFICNWMAADPGNRMVVVDEKAASIRERARGAIARSWSRWLESHRLTRIDQKLEHVTWRQIAAALSASTP